MTAAKGKSEVDQLILRLHVLRNELDQALEQYTLRVGSRITEMLEHLEGRSPVGEKTEPPGKADLATMLEKIDKTRLKPKRGRGKDLKRIQDLVEDLAGMINLE